MRIRHRQNAIYPSTPSLTATRENTQIREILISKDDVIDPTRN